MRISPPVTRFMVKAVCSPLWKSKYHCTQYLKVDHLQWVKQRTCRRGGLGWGAALHARKWRPGTQNHGTQAVFLTFLSYLTAWVPFQALALWCEGSRRGPYATEHLFSWVLQLGGHSCRSNASHSCLLKETIRLSQTRVWQDGTGVDL